MQSETEKQFKKRKDPKKHARSKQRGIIRREERRKKAESLLEARNKLSPQEQIQRLDWRLGSGKGAKKERIRLASQMK